MILAESDARKNEPLLNIAASESLDDASADSGDEAEGREVVIVSRTLTKSAANVFLLNNRVKAKIKNKAPNIFFCI
jgi:hypothetical protein